MLPIDTVEGLSLIPKLMLVRLDSPSIGLYQKTNMRGRVGDMLNIDLMSLKHVKLL